MAVAAALVVMQCVAAHAVGAMAAMDVESAAAMELECAALVESEPQKGMAGMIY